MWIYNKFGGYVVPLYGVNEIKIAITEIRTYKIKFSKPEAHILSTLLESDDRDELQNRWNLLVYAEFCRQHKIPLADELVDLYSLDEGEYDLYPECVCGSEPILGLFEESAGFPLTEFELEILKRSTFEFYEDHLDRLNHVDDATRAIIVNKKIPRV